MNRMSRPGTPVQRPALPWASPMRHVGLACHPLHAFGSPMQKESFLRPMLRGDKLGACAHGARGRVGRGAIATTAELDGGFYVINGHKIFITNAGRGRYLYPLCPYRRAGHGRPERLRGVQ